MLEYLIKGTNENSKHIIEKYQFFDESLKKEFKKKRKQKDDVGNNSMHYAFEISNLEMRYKFLKLLIDEEVGELNKSNRPGQMPFQIEHV